VSLGIVLNQKPQENYASNLNLCLLFDIIDRDILPLAAQEETVARPSYGPEVKNRTKQVLQHLLDFANDQYLPESPCWQQLETQIQIHWQTDRQLVVRTKIRYLEKLSQELGSPLLGDQIREALKRMEDFLGILQDNRPHRSGSEIWHFTLSLWYNRWEHRKNLAAFDLLWQEQRLLQNKKISTGSTRSKTQSPWKISLGSFKIIDLTAVDRKFGISLSAFGITAGNIVKI
jgi:hypothetical protein